ncbi:MAG: putative nucleotide-diphospho-sugar transferase [Pseudomonadota bacterium]
MYVKLAERAAQTFLDVMPDLPLDLMTDGKDPVNESLFDEVRIGPGEGGARARLEWMQLTRFERTLHVDCDVTLLVDISDVFALLDKFDLAVAHDQSRNAVGNSEPQEAGIPDAFPQFNCGVICYRNTPEVLGFLAEWRRLYLERGDPRDQPTFRLLAWQSDLRIGVLPAEYNLVNLQLLYAWAAEHAAPRLLHTPRLHRKLKLDGHLHTDIDDLLGAPMAEKVRRLMKAREINLTRRPLWRRKRWRMIRQLKAEKAAQSD